MSRTRPEWTSPFVLALVLQLVALWPAWRWYADRLLDSANEPWGLLALATACLLPGRRTLRAPAADRGLLVPALIVALYAAAYPLLPQLATTLLAMTALG